MLLWKKKSTTWAYLKKSCSKYKYSFKKKNQFLVIGIVVFFSGDISMLMQFSSVVCKFPVWEFNRFQFDSFSMFWIVLLPLKIQYNTWKKQKYIIQSVGLVETHTIAMLELCHLKTRSYLRRIKDHLSLYSHSLWYDWHHSSSRNSKWCFLFTGRVQSHCRQGSVLRTVYINRLYITALTVFNVVTELMLPRSSEEVKCYCFNTEHPSA